ncbi:SpoIVD-associated factor A [compost metagenome]
MASIIIYVIQAGDTLWSLAKKYSTTVMDLVKLNDLDEKETLKPGCKLLIPGRAVI